MDFKNEKMTGCIIAIFTSTSIFLLWLGEITHMSYDALKVVLSLNIKCRYVSFNNALPLRSLNPMIWYLFFFVIGFIQQLYWISLCMYNMKLRSFLIFSKINHLMLHRWGSPKSYVTDWSCTWESFCFFQKQSTPYTWQLIL